MKRVFVDEYIFVFKEYEFDRYIIFCDGKGDLDNCLEF